MNIDSWKSQALSKGAYYLIIMYDPDDNEIYPVFVMPNENLKHLCSCLKLSEGHQKIKEIINLKNNVENP